MDRHDEARVLVVDDEAAIRVLVAKIIERAGFPVDVAANGLEAIEKIDARPYAVLVVDLMMPQVDGYAVIDHVRSIGRPRPAIIVVTACDSAAIRRLDGAMVHAVIRKPFDIEVLSDFIVAAAKAYGEQRDADDADADAGASPDIVPLRSA
jgi:DNA-binding response OmpR family regulator